MVPGCHHNSLFNTRTPNAKLREEDCLSAGTQRTTDLVSGKSGKSLISRHSYLNRKAHQQRTEDVFTGKLPVGIVYRRGSLEDERHFCKNSSRAGHQQAQELILRNKLFPPHERATTAATI